VLNSEPGRTAVYAAALSVLVPARRDLGLLDFGEDQIPACLVFGQPSVRDAIGAGAIFELTD